MNKHQLKGRIEQGKGRLKKVAGKLGGNRRVEHEGRVDEAAGRGQADYGDAKEQVKDTARRVIDKA